MVRSSGERTILTPHRFFLLIWHHGRAGARARAAESAKKSQRAVALSLSRRSELTPRADARLFGARATAKPAGKPWRATWRAAKPVGQPTRRRRAGLACQKAFTKKRTKDETPNSSRIRAKHFTPERTTPTIPVAALMEGNRARVHRRGAVAWGSNGHWRAVDNR